METLTQKMQRYHDLKGDEINDMTKDEFVEDFDKWLLTDIYKQKPSHRRLIELIVQSKLGNKNGNY
jgi:transcriptional regulator of aromatic amino acid metabolism